MRNDLTVYRPYGPVRGTLRYYDAEVEHTLDETRHVGVSILVIKRELAISWLTRDRPASNVFARLWWLFKLARVLW